MLDPWSWAAGHWGVQRARTWAKTWAQLSARLTESWDPGTAQCVAQRESRILNTIQCMTPECQGTGCDLTAAKSEAWQQLGGEAGTARGVGWWCGALTHLPPLCSKVSTGQRNPCGGAQAPAEPAGFSRSHRAGEGL